VIARLGDSFWRGRDSSRLRGQGNKEGPGPYITFLFVLNSLCSGFLGKLWEVRMRKQARLKGEEDQARNNCVKE